MTSIPDDIHAFNADIVDEFRSNSGKVGGQFENIPLLLLTTTGAKSGLLRLSPLAYFDFDGKLFIIGSFGGVDYHPGWVHNLRVNPVAYVEIGTEGYEAIARELPPSERERVSMKMADVHQTIGEYLAKANRIIPLFELTRVQEPPKGIG